MNTRFLLVAALTASSLALTRDAAACGGCFTQTQSMTTQVVTDHRMVMAIHANESILWDQIRYSGDPSEFSWVLPVTGNVTVDVASSEFFDQLESATAPIVRSPPIRTSCGGGGGFGCGSASNAAPGVEGDGAGNSDTVMVLHEATVGPYETVTLRSTDANALANWLASHGYSVPPSVQPVVDYYVSLNMDFVALRLQPGQGVSAMQPVRVRYASANFVLPLRMISAGAGEKLGITLWVFGSARYEAANFMNARIEEDKLVWDWDSQRSNYTETFDLAVRNAGGRAFVTEYAQNPYYTTADTEASVASAPDWELARGGASYDAPYATVTRLRTNVPVSLLSTDLLLQASADTSSVSNVHAAQHTTGTYPGVTCSSISTLPEPEDLAAHPTRTIAGAIASVLATVWLRRRRRGR